VAPAPIVPPTPAATLDFKSLESRLRQTKAIGVLTKLSLKNQIDDLLDGFRAYTSDKARRHWPNCAATTTCWSSRCCRCCRTATFAGRDIVKSRSAIWNILEDSRKFTESNLMAGAMP